MSSDQCRSICSSLQVKFKVAPGQRIPRARRPVSAAVAGPGDARSRTDSEPGAEGSGSRPGPSSWPGGTGLIPAPATALWPSCFGTGQQITTHLIREAAGPL